MEAQQNQFKNKTNANALGLCVSKAFNYLSLEFNLYVYICIHILLK